MGSLVIAIPTVLAITLTSDKETPAVQEKDFPEMEESREVVKS